MEFKDILNHVEENKKKFLNEELKKPICFRCNGKGGYEQLTGFSEDDTAWDLCPACNGTGIEPDDYWERGI